MCCAVLHRTTAPQCSIASPPFGYWPIWLATFTSLHVGAIYYADDCAEVADPNVAGPAQSNFGIGATIVSTHGGNDLKLDGKSLHAYWDDGTVTGAMRLAAVNKKAVTDFARYVIAHPPDGWTTAGGPETWPQQWATEIMPVANAALTKVHIGDGVHAENGPDLKCTWPVTLDRDYTNWANQQALTQLSKAGFRLAAILRTVFR
jgi:S1/P1 nuclease